MLKNRRIRCEISKTVQEESFEPIRVTMSIEGDIMDTANMEKEFDYISNRLEDLVYKQISKDLV